MRRLLLLLIILGLPPKAHAQNLLENVFNFDPGNFFDELLKQICTETSGIGEFFRLDDFCKVATVLKQGDRAEKFLNYAKGTIFDASMGTLFNAFKPGNTALGAIGGVLGDLTETIRKAYSIPYEVVDGIANAIRGELYRWAYGATAERYANTYNSLSNALKEGYQPSGITLTSPQDLEGKFKEAGTYGEGAPEGYDSATLEGLRSGLASVSQSMSETAQGGKDTLLKVTEGMAKNVLPDLEAEAAAKRAEEKAREKAHTTAQAAAAKAVGEKEASLAGKVTEVAIDKKDPTTGEVLQESLATWYKKRAENALSDRELLQIQVEAIADLMRNSALVDQLTAEYLRATLSQQVLSTEALREEVKLLRKELVGEESPGMGEEGLKRKMEGVVEEIETERQKALQQISPAISAIDALCAAYGLGSCWEEYKAEVEASGGGVPPQQ